MLVQSVKLEISLLSWLILVLHDGAGGGVGGVGVVSNINKLIYV